jgi:tetratricopeptide (TPR) repeat protein
MVRSALVVVVLIVVAVSSAVRAGDRDTAMALCSTVEASLAKGEAASAMEICKRAVAADPACPTAYYKMAQCLEQTNKPRDAFKNYKTAAELAKKENDVKLQRTANMAAEKLGTGLIQISEADQKLIVKLLPLADDAFADEQLETARSAYQAILALQPAHDKAKEGLDKTEKAIAARGDPVKAKIAGAMLAEIYYWVASGDKKKAAEIAEDVKTRHSGTAAGKEASDMLANNFEPPKNLGAEIAAAKAQLKEQAKKAAKAPKPAVKDPSVSVSMPAAPPPVDVDALEKTAMDDTKKLPKDQLVPAYKDTFAKGKDFFGKATPGTEGNQKNLHCALEQFIRCEALYMRIEEEKLNTPDVDAMQKQAGTSRYSCMKMTILSH